MSMEQFCKLISIIFSRRLTATLFALLPAHSDSEWENGGKKYLKMIFNLKPAYISNAVSWVQIWQKNDIFL